MGAVSGRKVDGLIYYLRFRTVNYIMIDSKNHLAPEILTVYQCDENYLFLDPIKIK